MSVTQELAVNFNDTKLAYRYKTTSELKQAEWMFRFLNTPVIGALGKSGLKLAIQLGLPVKAAIKATLYKQFVGGETLEGCLPIAEKLAKFNVMSILDYSEEGKHSEADFEHAFNELYSNVKFSATHDTTIFAVFKPTAFISSAIMEKISEGKALNSSEEASWEKAKTRFDLLCKTAFEHNYRIMIDAEEYYTQEAIDELTYSMMAKYNKEDIHVINTYQMYRHDRLDALKKAFDRAKSNGYKLGAKLVRGAYMEKERARAIAMNYPDPINATKEQTDNNYDDAVRFCMENLDNLMVFIGTHNEKSSRLGAEYLVQQGLPRNHRNVWFSQLYGMSDNISFNLAAAGFNVVKYVPYGPVRSVTPYLIRRADENSSVAGQAIREIKMLKEEIIRRNKEA